MANWMSPCAVSSMAQNCFSSRLPMRALQVILGRCSNRRCGPAATPRARGSGPKSPRCVGADLPELDGRHLDVQVDAIQQRSRNAAQVVLDFAGRRSRCGRGSLETGNDGGLGGIVRRNEDAGFLLGASFECDGEHTFDRSYPPSRASSPTRTKLSSWSVRAVRWRRPCRPRWANRSSVLPSSHRPAPG